MKTNNYGLGLKRGGTRNNKLLYLLDGINGDLIDDDWVFDSIKEKGGRKVKLISLGNMVIDEAIQDNPLVTPNTIVRGYFNERGLLCYNTGSQRNNKTIEIPLKGLIQKFYEEDEKRIVLAEYRNWSDVSDANILSFYNLVGIEGNKIQLTYEEVHDFAMKKWGIIPN
jgi:hypothetical protein